MSKAPMCTVSDHLCGAQCPSADGLRQCRLHGVPHDHGGACPNCMELSTGEPHPIPYRTAFETWGAKVWGGVGAEAGALTRGADTIAHDRVK